MIVFDLDGTLSNPAHRLHHILGEEKDWDAFFKACGEDAPIQYALDILEMYLTLGRHRVEIWTGRSEIVRVETTHWLRDHGVSMKRLCSLRMRPFGDKRHDVDVKMEWLREIEGEGFSVELAFEDRTSVVEWWRANGIPCYQVAPGDF